MGLDYEPRNPGTIGCRNATGPGRLFSTTWAGAALRGDADARGLGGGRGARELQREGVTGGNALIEQVRRLDDRPKRTRGVGGVGLDRAHVGRQPENDVVVI